MGAAEILFNFFAVSAFFAAATDHWFVGRGYVVVPLRVFMLGCFVFTEAYLAVHAQPAMWLYVLLNLWGLANLYLGRKSPLRTGKTLRKTSSSDSMGITG